MRDKAIKSALISVFHKEGLDQIALLLHQYGVTIYSTGGTQDFLAKLGIPVVAVETLTGYPSILDGRVKTLHPKIFGGILAKRDDDHLGQLESYNIPEIDLVIVDLYPFEATVKGGGTREEIIEKIDIGGISLIRAAAKNFHDTVIVPSMADYEYVLQILSVSNNTSLEQRTFLATRAFEVSSHYDSAIFGYFNEGVNIQTFKKSIQGGKMLRYGENPHQKAIFHGDMTDCFDVLTGKELSYNNLIDVDAAIALMNEFKEEPPTFAILKHNNACGIATRSTQLESWKDALAGDPISAFGGILITNTQVDLETAKEIDQLFYEVLIAPSFEQEAFNLLKQKKNRILLQLHTYPSQRQQFRSLLNGVIVQDMDHSTELEADFKVVTKVAPTSSQIKDLVFANKCTKHLKSNAIALVKNGQLLGMGCGQTSRVDALQQAIHKAQHFGLDVAGAVMSSEAFFPFPDCVEIAHHAGIAAVVQPGGSIKDQDSIDYCDNHEIAMVLTGIRHFKH
jgi:phosphoribosylaminoimidazolecarboxamide formyltransferase/IMP cyclohydrolase